MTGKRRPAIIAFLVARAAEAALCILLLTVVVPAAGGMAEHAAAWARHEFLHGFILTQVLAWRMLGRLIELRLIAQSLAAAIYGVVAGYPLAFTLCFIGAQAAVELGVWWRMQRA